MRIVLIFRSKYDDSPVSIPLFANDKIHTDGSITLSPTRIDGTEWKLPAERVLGWLTWGQA